MAWASAGANAITKATSGFAGRSDVIRLYRDVQHQLARVLTIYDITDADCPLPVARESIRAAFEKNKDVQDPRVVSLLVARGQQELEETLMQWKQKSQLMRTLTNHSAHRRRARRCRWRRRTEQARPVPLALSGKRGCPGRHILKRK